MQSKILNVQKSFFSSVKFALAFYYWSYNSATPREGLQYSCGLNIQTSKQNIFKSKNSVQSKGLALTTGCSWVLISWLDKYFFLSPNFFIKNAKL